MVLFFNHLHVLTVNTLNDISQFLILFSQVTLSKCDTQQTSQWDSLQCSMPSELFFHQNLRPLRRQCKDICFQMFPNESHAGLFTKTPTDL